MEKELNTIKKLPIFNFYTGIGGSVCNGNGYMHRYWRLYFLRKMYSGVLWRWKIGNGDDGVRTN